MSAAPVDLAEPITLPDAGPNPVSLLLLLACGEHQESDWSHATFHPAHRIELRGPSTLSTWVDAHGAGDVQSVWISPVRSSVRFAPLSKL